MEVSECLLVEKVLITGGSGFLGRNLAVAMRDKYKVCLAARNHAALKKASDATRAEIVPMDVSSIESVKDAMSCFRPDTVIHAAATKYVDWSEIYPHEAIDVNVVGGLNIFRACRDSGVKNLIFISTDKASPPVVNTYGLSKAIIERSFALSGSHEGMSVVSVRYGNVLWSTGSFLHAWEAMAFDDGKTITSTGSMMTRFFFTIADAISLVTLTLENIDCLKGSIISLPMKTATISDFLNVFCELYGAHYKLVGQRGGERDEEFLIGQAELAYSSSILIDNIPLYQITPNKLSASPLVNVISSSTSPKLSLEEIRSHIQSKPNLI